MTKPYIIGWLLMGYTSLYGTAQNLIPNPSFEDTKRCAQHIGQFSEAVMDWNSPTFGTSDVFNACGSGKTRIPNNYLGQQVPFDGSNYAGIYAFSSKNYREYLQVPLLKPLEKNVEYTLSFYISLAEYSDFALNNLGALFTDTPINSTSSKVLGKKELRKSQVNNYQFYDIENPRFYDNKNVWTQLSITFKASGFEQFLILGNFNNNKNTDLHLIQRTNQYNGSYYYIDWVHLIPVKSNIEEVQSDENTAIVETPNTSTKMLHTHINYKFESVVFEHNSTVLNTKAESEILWVYEHLVEHPNLNILISGHTDTIGTAEKNQQLSLERAQSVANYLITLGIPSHRIEARGYGSSNPVTSNSTELGRAKNRRVEFKLLD